MKTATEKYLHLRMSCMLFLDQWYVYYPFLILNMSHLGSTGEVAVTVTVSTRYYNYVKLTIYIVNRRIYRNSSTNPNLKPNPIPNLHIIDLVDTVTTTSAAQPQCLISIGYAINDFLSTV